MDEKNAAIYVRIENENPGVDADLIWRLFWDEIKDDPERVMAFLGEIETEIDKQTSN